MKFAPNHFHCGLLTCIAIALCSAPCSLAAARESATDPDPARFAAEIERFEKSDQESPPPTGAVLFVGSSSIRLWTTEKGFPGLALINRGFGGSHVSDVNHYADRIVLKYKPRVIVFYAGDNDIAGGKSPQQMVDDFKQFVALIRSDLPQTRILYLPIKPSLARWKLWPTMREANRQIEALAQSNDHLDYIDTATPMLGADDSPPPELLLDDGLHMNAAGYELWTAILKPALAAAEPRR